MLFALLLALCLLVYLPALYATPIWDDIQLFQDKKILKWKFYGPKDDWHIFKIPRWITRLTFGLTFRAFRKVREEWRPTMIVSALHLTNILLHWLNSCLVYSVSTLFVGDRAIVAALLFAVHPLAASTVAPIISRSSLLSSTFIFMAIGLTELRHPFLAVGCAVAAFYAKEDGIAVAPLIVVLTALLDPWAGFLVFGFCLLGVQRFAKTLIAMGTILGRNNGDTNMVNAGLTASLPQPTYSATAIVENLRRWPLWMIGFERNPDPDPKHRSIRTAFNVLLPLAAFAFAVHSPLLFTILISPWTASWFFRLPDPVSELRAYSTLFGGCCLLSFIPMPLVVPLVVWFAALACYRAWLQQNEMALWKHAWNEGSKKLKVAINLAAAYQRYQKLQEAFDWHNKALQLAPDNGLVKMNLALWFDGQAKLHRQNAMTPFVTEGKAEQKNVNEAIEKANQCLAQAVVLAREGLANCPLDPWVRHYGAQIEAHAAKIGLQVQVVSQ